MQGVFRVSSPLDGSLLGSVIVCVVGWWLNESLGAMSIAVCSAHCLLCRVCFMDGCQYAASGYKPARSLRASLCPEHQAPLEPSAPCGMRFFTADTVDDEKKLLPQADRRTYLWSCLGSGLPGQHSHPPFTRSGLTTRSLATIQSVVKAKPYTKPAAIMSGVAIPGRTALQGSMIRDDVAFANRENVARAIIRQRKAQGIKPSNAVTSPSFREKQIDRAVEQLNDMAFKYVRRSSNIKRFSLLLASREMLEAFCSFDIYTFMMQDFSFKMVKGQIDDWEVSSMDWKHHIVMALIRMLAEAKDNDGHCAYWNQIMLECRHEGLNFVWGVSCVMMIQDLHQGQASGLAKHLHLELRPEEGPEMYTRVVKACKSHFVRMMNECIYKRSNLASKLTTEATMRLSFCPTELTEIG